MSGDYIHTLKNFQKPDESEILGNETKIRSRGLVKFPIRQVFENSSKCGCDHPTYHHQTHVDVSSFPSKTNLASLKTEVDKIDADKLKTVLFDLAKLSNVVKSNVVKKTEYNKLFTKVDNIDTTDFVLKTKYENDGADLEKKVSDVNKKIPDVSNFVKKQT